MADCGVRVGSASFGLGWVLPRVAVHVVKPLGFGIVRLHIGVDNRPSRGSSTVMANLAEVFLAQPKQRRTEEFRIAADVVIGVRVKFLAVLIVPDFFGLIFSLEVDRPRVPVVLFSGHIAAAFNKQNL